MTISDIARMANVSSAAVSRYFNNGYISEEKREAIRKVVEQTGFRPSAQARTLRTKKTKLIGVILPKIDSASLGSVVAGVLSVLDASGYEMLLADTQNNPQKELNYLSIFSEKQVDAVIFLGTVITPRHKRALSRMTLPVVIVGQNVSGCNCIYHDDYHAAYELTRLLLEKGRKNIAMLSAVWDDQAAGRERYRGYCDAAAQAGCEDAAERCVITDFTMQSGYEKAGELLERFGEPDALLCATDSIAVGAMMRLREAGIAIPGRIMLAGHGGSRISAAVTPDLTTAAYAYEESGRLAAKRVLELLQHPDDAPRSVMLGFRVIERGSTGAVVR